MTTAPCVRRSPGTAVRRGVLVLGALLTVLAAAAPSQAATLGCGDVVTASVVLHDDLVNCPGDGLVVAAGDVVVDLGGHRITGAGSGTGIVVAPPEGGQISGVRVTGGTVRGFDYGVRVEGDPDRPTRLVELSRLRVRGNGFGLYVGSATSDTVLRANRVDGNRLDGIRVATDTSPVVVLDNDLLRNGGDGLRAAEDSVTLVSGNRATRNGGSGLSITDSVAVITGNWLTRNAAYGLVVFDRVPFFLPRYVVAGNVALFNGIGGLLAGADPAPPGGPSGSGNVARRNGAFDCELVACARR